MGIFLGYTSTDENIRYIDLTSGVVKNIQHTVFDEAWYLQVSRPPAAQLLYDLGLTESMALELSNDKKSTIHATYLPAPRMSEHLLQPKAGARQIPLPL